MKFDALISKVPAKIQGAIMLKLFGLLKVPMLGFLRPSVVEISETNCIVKIPLTRRSKNHLNSIYFGALAAGADCASGLMAMKFIKESGQKIDLVFKSFSAEFHKRAEGDTYFTNTQGGEIKALVEKCLVTGEREELAMKIIATTPDKLGDLPVASFIIILSLKLRT